MKTARDTTRQFTRTKAGTGLLALLLLAAAPAGPATAAEAPTDAHALYEQRCSKCHFEHGADLARQKMTSKAGAISITRTGKPIDSVLNRHHGVTLTAPELAALKGLFEIGIDTGGIFQHRCASCHKSGVTFARQNLELKDGRLTGKKTGTDVRAFLAGHGGAEAAEIDKLARMLQYQVETAPAREPQRGTTP